MAEGVLLFGRNSYRNVVCLGTSSTAGAEDVEVAWEHVAPVAAIERRRGPDSLVHGRGRLAVGLAARVVGGFDDIVRRFVLTLWNTYAFFVTYANVDDPDLAAAPPPAERGPLDRWMLSRLHGLVAQ